MLALRSSKQLYKTLLLLDNQPLLLFSLQVMTNSMTQWTAACQASISLIISQSLPKFMSIQLVIPLNHHILYHPLPPAFSASKSFPLSQRFTSGGQSIGASASASVLPKCIQGWFPLGLTGYCSWGSQGKNIEVVCMFCQNSPLWPVHLGCPYTVWLIVSLT